ncbi:MAG: asparagine synthase (glutamine-hydrolyzing) [Rhodospirillaceae bacterium]|jgi:asparagine synthase (glutamine-hydrolysing)|nr:asparagine synthase (glutamine-hydrolyzing) [Rhodospirillaceae bacterium]MBT7484810.1 asparagine synthase (glutamine-hydrolyzing) [Rhodospirillales bacterium]MBT5034842.1 asparagine synthase (glutamine-hydrolyzing) [Rhodospirillaceae bacterium]MBT6219689.1 asparagine synthase (glutamine-hydrolyzing) [Rhodospirillaceae bacterium]MBT6361584.1 asparagine synthase (glutamine-hydrolyzing) [Rhodospirillaceae bacterium]
MCGIAGSTTATSDVLQTMGARLRHRGPDSDGTWQAPGGILGLAHTRLKVIDLSDGGHQPMVSDDRRFALVFNGEIYNYKALRRDLESKGESFRSDSDTEVLFVLLRREGKKALARLVGMFSFAFWNGESGELLLARDRLGIKPLVYAPLANRQIAFASEIEALRAHPGIDLNIDRQAVSEFLACLYVPQPLCIHKGIRKLPPGHTLTWRAGTTTIEPYWQPAFKGTRQPTLDEAVEEILPLVRQSVIDRLVADVPVGCFLSGGIDSSVIAALMAEESKAQGGPAIKTFTMTFDEATYDERAAAKQVADHIGSDHTELPASSDLASRLNKTLKAFGEPFGNPTSLLIDDLSRKAREHVTVALVGDGGDEVFAGYPRYKGGLWAQKYRHLPGWLRRGVVAPIAGLIPESTEGRHGLRRAREFLTSASLPDANMYAAWVEYFSPEERAQMLPEDTAPKSPIAELYQKSPSDHPLDAMQQTDLQSFLPSNLLAYGDAMSMRHSLELRLPLIDHRLVDAVGTLAPGLRVQDGMKTLLRAVAQKLLPTHIVDAPKRGFNPPMGVWLKNDLASMVKDRLTPERMADVGLAWEPIDQLLSEHHGSRRDHSLKVWALLVLDTWRDSRRGSIN